MSIEAAQTSSIGLGRLIRVHPIAPSYIQRAVVVSLLSFLFFLAMLVAFLLRQQIGYLILAAAFFVLNIFTLVGFVMLRQNSITVFENGLRYRKSLIEWNDIVSIEDLNNGLSIVKTDGTTIKIPRSIDDLGRLNSHIREKSRI